MKTLLTKTTLPLMLFAADISNSFAQAETQNPSSAAGIFWRVKGNANTIPGIGVGENFVGTTDNTDLVIGTRGIERIRVLGQNGYVGIGTSTPTQLLDVNGDALINGITVGRGGGSVFANTAAGYRALFSSLFGSNNTAAGFEAMYGNSNGSDNVAYGFAALRDNTTGNENTAIGSRALHTNMGIGNTANGFYTLEFNYSGNYNSAFGYRANVLAPNLTNATAIGSRATVSASNSLVLGSVNGFNGATSNVNVGIGTTTPAKMLDVKGDALINGATVGRGGGIFNHLSNTTVGYQALDYTFGSGIENVAVGYQALYTNNSGRQNTANGYQALYLNVSGWSNTATGYMALRLNQSGNENSAFGFMADVVPPNLTNATAIGARATVTTSNTLVLGSVSGINGALSNVNVGIGTIFPLQMLDVKGDALINEITVGRGNGNVTTNTATGFEALRANSTGAQNTANGYYALHSNGTGNKNTANGWGALINNYSGTGNTATGYNALTGNTSSNENTAYGFMADIAAGTLTNSTAIGARAYVADNNTLVLGSIAGVNGATSSVKVGIGTSAPKAMLHLVSPNQLDVPCGDVAFTRHWNSATDTRASALFHYYNSNTGMDNLAFAVSGDGGLYNQPNQLSQIKMLIQADGFVGIGTTTPQEMLSVAGNICYSGAIGGCSDIRYKTNITPLTNSLARVTQMKGVYYSWKTTEFPDKQFSDTRQLGFIAQDIELLFPELVTTHADGYKSVDYSKFTPVLAEAIKEQQKMIDAQQREIEELKLIVTKLGQKGL